MELTMLAFIGMCAVAVFIAVGAYTVLTRVKIRSYRYETDENGNEKVIDENE
jgi:hypothetical protein